jgi:hypothetical protein
MREDVEPLSSIAHAADDGKPASETTNLGQLFYIAVNGYNKSVLNENLPACLEDAIAYKF